MKFTIVTPTRNSARFLSETIHSVVSQNCAFDIEYIIVDNCSTDGTLDIVKRYAEQVDHGAFNNEDRTVSLRWVSEADAGMYDAINKGLALATGDVYSWLNSDDFYLPGALDSVGRSLLGFPEINWAKGITSYVNEHSSIVEVGKCYLYDQAWTQAGMYGQELFFIQQDSVFWRAELWHCTGGIDPRLQLAGDYYLWTRFAQHDPLYSINAYVSCFRRVEGQLSRRVSAYMGECNAVRSALGRRHKLVRTYFRVFEPRIPTPLRPAAYRVAVANRTLPVIDIRDGRPTMRSKHYHIG